MKKRIWKSAISSTLLRWEWTPEEEAKSHGNVSGVRVFFQDGSSASSTLLVYELEEACAQGRAIEVKE